MGRGNKSLFEASGSHDHDHLYKLLFLLSMEASQELASIGQAVLEMFEDNGHMHVYSRGTGADEDLMSNFLHK